MGRRSRTATVLVITVLGLTLYAGLSRSAPEPAEDVAADVPGQEQPLSPASNEAPADLMGLPTDPLPAPLALASGDGDLAATRLAQTIMAGGSDALPALVTALARSGFAVNGSDGAVAVPAEGPDAGLVLESWQVRSLIGVVGARKHVSVPLASLATGLVATFPSLNDRPVAQLLADGIVDSAESDEPALRFWARFIIELGKQPHAYPSYDLPTKPDITSVRLDAIQLSLIVRRLVAELGMSSGTERVANVGTPGLFSMPVVYADEPCTPTGPPPRPKVSRSAFGELIRTVTAPGRALDRAASPSIENWLDYENLMLMFAALKVDVEMEGGPPLRRTKTTTPGEQKRIRATVSLDGAPLEWLNCYRAWMNSHGRELRNPPRSNGPVPNVAVEFDLDGRTIVRIPTSAPAAERGLPGATRTDSQGIARLAVEGEPQDRQLQEPSREERKTASVTVSATVKASDLLTRSHPSEGIASTDVVHGWVTEQDFTIDVPYPFEVIDWSDTPGRWTGSISVVETTLSSSSGEAPFNRGAHTIQETETDQITVRVTDTTSDQSGLATLKGQTEAKYTRLKTFAGWTLESCGNITGRKMNNTSRESSNGTGTGDSAISVTMFDDGTYLIGASSTDFVMPITGQNSGELEVFRSNGNNGCYVATKADTQEHVPLERPVGGLIQATGRVDPKAPNVLKGSVTEEHGPSGTPQPGTTYRRVKTTTWEFTRH